MGSTEEKALVCEKCGGKLNVDDTKTVATCPYCETSYSVSGLLNDSEQAGAERAENELNRFKKSKLAKVLIVFSIVSLIFCLMFFGTERILSGVLGVFSFAGFVAAILIGMRIIKAKRNMHILPTIAGFALLIGAIAAVNVYDTKNTHDYQKYSWSEIVLNQSLPQPPSDEAYLSFNSKTRLSMDLKDVTPTQFYSYIEQCKQAGFTIEAEEDEDSFSAYNTEGYKLYTNLSDGEDAEMYLSLDAPEELGEFKWPTSELGKIVPKPKSNIGKVSSYKDGYFYITVGNMTKDDYDAYVEECAAAGFNVNYDKNDKYYSADNSDGYHILLEYLGFNKIRIEAKSPDYKDPFLDSSSAVVSTVSSVSEVSESSSIIVSASLEQSSKPIESTVINSEISVPVESSTAESSSNTNEPESFVVESSSTESSSSSEPSIEPPTSSTESAPQNTPSEVDAPLANNITLISMTNPVRRNEDATITIQGEPNTQYSISVYYSSGASKADGLEPKMSDTNGYVSWTWHIGGKTGLGDNKRIKITGGGKTYETKFSVVG